MDKIFAHKHMLQAAQASMDSAAQDGLPPVCLALYNTAGNLLYFSRMVGATERAVGISMAKARTSALMGISTRALHQRLKTEHLCLEDFCGSASTSIAGGIPLLLEGSLVGGVGVSGAKPDEDEYLAQRFADMLLP